MDGSRESLKNFFLVQAFRGSLEIDFPLSHIEYNVLIDSVDLLLNKSFDGFTVLDLQPEFIVISKSPGVDVHQDGEVAGICERVASALGISKPYLVHRLDKVTSGLLLLARDSESCAELSKLFREKEIQKYYLALADKKPKKKQGWIKGDMERSRRSSWKLLNSQKNPAVTQFFSFSVKPGLRAFILKPRTGKTHQLRVAMKSLGAPICGDPLYSEHAHSLSYDRTYLHAYILSFVLHGQVYRYQDIPSIGGLFNLEEFKAISEQWMEPEQLSWPE